MNKIFQPIIAAFYDIIAIDNTSIHTRMIFVLRLHCHSVNIGCFRVPIISICSQKGLHCLDVLQIERPITSSLGIESYRKLIIR